ncbi:MAG: hypothetical protein JXO72_15775 [Vicinamibacteria bacterium]|nr:hypothetical protein [Vicinamibacteria bacterium]
MLKHIGVSSACIIWLLGAAPATRTSSTAPASLPAEALAFPADSLAVLSLDVKRALASPLDRDGGPAAEAVRKTTNDLRARFGVDAARDVDRLWLALGAADSDSLLLLTGRFNRAQVGRILKGDKRDPETVDLAGVKAYVVKERLANKTTSQAICVLNPQKVLVGEPSAVSRLLNARHAQRRSLLTNPTLSRLIDQVKPEADFWLAADAALLKRTRLDRGAPGLPPMLDLPQLQDFLITGVFAEALTLRLIGKTTDEATARNTSDLVKGLLLLASMNAKHPEWQKVASLVTVAVKGPGVQLDARLPYALLAKLPSSSFRATRKKDLPKTSGND